eukprot:COSAG02_NODE_4474_length_5324_cov_19.463028_4_plen_50_part_00
MAIAMQYSLARAGSLSLNDFNPGCMRAVTESTEQPNFFAMVDPRGYMTI